MQFSIRKILYCNRAHSFYQTKARLIAVSLKTIRRLKKFLGFASPPHDGFADKYSIVTKENLQAVYAAPPIFAIIIHVARLLVKSFLFFFANCGFLRRIVVFFTAHAFEKPTKCETQQTATIATNDEMLSILRILEEVKKAVRHN